MLRAMIIKSTVKILAIFITRLKKLSGILKQLTMPIQYSSYTTQLSQIIMSILVKNCLPGGSNDTVYTSKSPSTIFISSQEPYQLQLPKNKSSLVVIGSASPLLHRMALGKFLAQKLLHLIAFFIIKECVEGGLKPDAFFKSDLLLFECIKRWANTACPSAKIRALQVVQGGWNSCKGKKWTIITFWRKTMYMTPPRLLTMIPYLFKPTGKWLQHVQRSSNRTKGKVKINKQTSIIEKVENEIQDHQFEELYEQIQSNHTHHYEFKDKIDRSNILSGSEYYHPHIGRIMHPIR